MEHSLGKKSIMQCAISICIVETAFCIICHHTFPFSKFVSGYATCAFWFSTFVFKSVFERSIMRYAIPIFCG